MDCIVPTNGWPGRVALCAALTLGIVPGIPWAQAQAFHSPSPSAKLSRLESRLATRLAEVHSLRRQVARLLKQKEVTAHPEAAGMPARYQFALTPSSTLTMARAHLAAWTVANQLPGGEVATVAATGSMRPLFDQHALLILEAAPFDSLQVGDIVTYRDPQLGIVIVHRLIERHGDRFWAKGDHNRRMDNLWVTRKNYCMRVCGILYTHQG